MALVVSARAATPADDAEVARLRRAGADDVLALRGGQALLDALNGVEIEGDLERGERVTMVGVVADTVVGYAIVARRGARAEVAELYCERAGRGVGVGHALLELATARAVEWGCVALDSHALPGDRGTKNFFEAHAMVSRLIVVSRSLLEATEPPDADR